MRHLKRNWKSFALVCALTVGSAWWWMKATATAQGVEEPPYAAVTPMQRQDLLAALACIDLDESALAALNLSGEQAVDVLATVRTWWESNAATLDELADTVAVKRAALDDLQRSGCMGGEGAATQQDITTARAELAAANAAFAAGHNGLRSAVTQELSGSQQATWAIIAQGWGNRMPMAMLELTGEQRHAYARAVRVHRLQLAAADSAEERRVADTAFQQAVSEILTQDNQQVLDSYAAYIEESAQAVHNAINTVLPTENQS